MKKTQVLIWWLFTLTMCFAFNVEKFEDMVASFLNYGFLPTESSLEASATKAFAGFWMYMNVETAASRTWAYNILNEAYAMLPDDLQILFTGMQEWCFWGYPLAKYHFIEYSKISKSRLSHLLLGRYYFEIWKNAKLGEYKVKVLKELDALDSQKFIAVPSITMRMEIAYHEKDREKIRELYSRGKKSLGDFPLFWKEIIPFLYNMKFYSLVSSSVLKLIEEGRVSDVERYYLGMAWYHLKRWQDAYNVLGSIDEAQLDDEKRSKLHDALGVILESNGDLWEAIKEYTKAIGQENDYLPYKHLGMAYLKTDLERKDSYAMYYLGIAESMCSTDVEVSEVMEELRKIRLWRVVKTVILPITGLAAIMILVSELLFKPRSKPTIL